MKSEIAFLQAAAAGHPLKKKREGKPCRRISGLRRQILLISNTYPPTDMLKAYPLNCLSAAVLTALTAVLPLCALPARSAVPSDGIQLDSSFGSLEYDAGSGSNTIDVTGKHAVLVNRYSSGTLTVRAGKNNEFSSDWTPVHISSINETEVNFIAGGDNIVHSKNLSSAIVMDTEKTVRLSLQAGGSNIIVTDGIGSDSAAIRISSNTGEIELRAVKDNILSGGEYGIGGEIWNSGENPSLLVTAGGRNEFSGSLAGIYSGGQKLEVIHGRENVFRGRRGILTTGETSSSTLPPRTATLLSAIGPDWISG